MMKRFDTGNGNELIQHQQYLNALDYERDILSKLRPILPHSAMMIESEISKIESSLLKLQQPQSDSYPYGAPLTSNYQQSIPRFRPDIDSRNTVEIGSKYKHFENPERRVVTTQGNHHFTIENSGSERSPRKFAKRKFNERYEKNVTIPKPKNPAYISRQIGAIIGNGGVIVKRIQKLTGTVIKVCGDNIKGDKTADSGKRPYVNIVAYVDGSRIKNKDEAERAIQDAIDMITPKFEDPYDREDSGSQYFEKEYSKGKSYSEEQDYSDDEQPKDRVYSEDEGEVYEKGFESESDDEHPQKRQKSQ